MSKRFIDRFEYEDKPALGYSPDIYQEVPVERSGYRSLGDQVNEMIRAGEQLADWRAATYPFPPDFEEMLETTPVFGDKLDVIDRFRWLQSRRAPVQAQEAIASEQPPAVDPKKIVDPPSGGTV